MKYYKYADDYYVPNGTRYIETDDDGNSFREVTFNGEVCLASNTLYPYYGMLMSDQPVDYAEIEEVAGISRSEFEEVWNKSLAQNFIRWKFAKLEYPLGTFVEGSLVVFYPQGVVVNLGNSVLGVADYNACKASMQTELMYWGCKVTANVSDYDDLNQWVILDSPVIDGRVIVNK
jgi:hypothetical protein